MNWNPLSWFRKPEVKLAPQPVEINPDKARQKQRAQMRLERVEAALAKKDKRPELREEAKKLRQFIEWLS